MIPRCAAIILAAGRSSRMGRPKALLTRGGKTVLEHLAEVYARAGVTDRVVVVSAGPVADAASKIDGIQVVEGDPSAQMIDSVARGLAILPAHVQAALVQPVDAPFTTVAVVRALMDGYRGVPRAPVYEGRDGHPVLIPRALFAHVAARSEGGLRNIVRKDREEVKWSDDSILADLDRPEDLEPWPELA